MAIFGPDISSYQGTPDMAAVRAAGNDYVIIKVTEGMSVTRKATRGGTKAMVGRPGSPKHAKRVTPVVTIDGVKRKLPVRYVNPTWSTNRNNAAAAGMVVGLYHFARDTDPVAEARYFINNIGGLRNGEFVVLDWEVPGDAANWSRGFLDEVARLTGVRAFVYLNQYYVNSFNWAAVAAAGYPLWLAVYDGDPWTFQSMKWWGAPPLKQYTDAAQIPGIAGNVDRNSFNGDRAGLLAYCKGGSAPAPAPPPPPPLGADMKLCRTDDGTIYLVTDTSVAATSDFALYMALRKVWSIDQPTAVTPDDIKRAQDDANWRLAEVVNAVVAKLGQQPQQPVNVDASAVAAALAGNTDLVRAIAKAAADEVSARLQS